MGDGPIRSTVLATDGANGMELLRGPTRRQVVVGAGVVLGAAALSATPFLRTLFTSITRIAQPAVGVVAPPSTRYPDLLGQLASGVRGGLAAHGQADAPVFAQTAANSAPSAAANAARELIEREKVDLVLVYASPMQAALLGSLAQEKSVPVVVVDPGAHVVTSADADSRVLAHSLGHWQGVWALGAWAGAQLGRHAYVISSLYESGFDVLSAFGHGLAKAGGSVLGTSITHARPNDVADAVRNAATSGADALFVAAAGHEADDILLAIAADKTASRLPLLVPGLSAERLAVVPGLSAFTALTWPVGQKSPFAMLGEDVGAIVAGAVHGGTKALPGGTSTLSGARGEVRLDLRKGLTDVPVGIYSASSTACDVTYKPVAAEGNTSVATVFADDIVAKPRTGWLDVYGSTL